MQYIDDVQTRRLTRVVEQPTLGRTTKTSVGSVMIYHTKAATIKGDFVTPTNWFHSTLAVNTTERWVQHRNYSNDGITTVLPYYVADNTPVEPYTFSTPFFTTGQIAPSAARTYSGDYNLPNVQALLKLNQQKVGISVMVAELSETVAYFASKAIGVVRFIGAIKRGKYHNALKAIGISRQAFYLQMPKTVAARFLEWKFAIKPLLHDIDDVQKVLNSKLAELDMQLYIVAEGKHERKIKQPAQSYWGENTYPYAYKLSTGYDLTQTTRTKLYARIDDMELLVQKALGLDTLAPAVYEMLPWSWLIDYAVNMGDVLQAYSATKGLTFISGYNSTRTYGTAEQLKYTSNYSDGTAPFNYAERHEYSVKVGVNSYNRIALTKFPLPRLSYVLPDISRGHIQNVIALVTSLGLGSKGFNRL